MLRVRPAVTDELRPGLAIGVDQLRAMLVALGVQEHCWRDVVLAEQLEQPEPTDAVAVLAPGPVVGVRMRQPRREGEVEAAFVVREVFERDGDVHRGTESASRPRLRPVPRLRPRIAGMSGVTTVVS